MAIKPEKERLTEEFLEWLWTEDEDNRVADLPRLLEITGLDEKDWERAGLEQAGLIEIAPDGSIIMTDQGRDYGRRMVRRHRLAERLLADVIHADDENESAACRFEHAIDEDIAEHICTLLGHPRTCPHGKSIPPGPCCRLGESTVESAIKSLGSLKPGESGRVAYIAAPDDSVLHRLAAMGIVPEAEVTLHQDHPGVVIRVGNTQVALDRETVDDIFVRSGGNSSNSPPFRHRRRRGWRFWHREL